MPQTTWKSCFQSNHLLFCHPKQINLRFDKGGIRGTLLWCETGISVLFILGETAREAKIIGQFVASAVTQHTSHCPVNFWNGCKCLHGDTSHCCSTNAHKEAVRRKWVKIKVARLLSCERDQRDEGWKNGFILHLHFRHLADTFCPDTHKQHENKLPDQLHNKWILH